MCFGGPGGCLVTHNESIIYREARGWAAPLPQRPPPEPIKSFTLPVFAKSVNELRTWRHDIREVLASNPMRTPDHPPFEIAYRIIYMREIWASMDSSQL